MSPFLTPTRARRLLAVTAVAATAAVAPASAQALNPQPEPPGVLQLSVDPLATVTLDTARGSLVSIVLLPPGPCIDACGISLVTR